MNQKRIFGFSLVELMVTLVVVSVVMAAMTPVITKKLKSSEITVGGMSDISTNCSEKYSSDCKLCMPNKCLSCFKTCPEDQTLDTASCKCSSCAASFGSQCLECSSSKCNKCSDGYFVNNSGICEICPAKYYCDGEKATICEPGKFNEATGQTACNNCTAGYYCVNGEKNACEPGKYSSAGASSCATCEKGYKCPGESNKILCGSGNEYQDETSQAVCKQCGGGRYLTNDRTACKTCETGNKCPGDGTKTACTGMEYQPNEGQEACLLCNGGAGGYHVDNGTTCSICPKGYKCPGTGKRILCGNGAEYQDETGQSTCKACIEGSIPIERNACNVCANGTYGTAGACLVCPSGYYCQGGVPKPCPANSLPNASTGATGCNCNSGYYLNSSDSCAACPAYRRCYEGKLVPCPSSSSTPAGTQYCVCSGDNYYKPSNNTCAACSTLTPHCVSCTVTDNETASAECTRCESGYELKDGVCEVVSCPELSMEVKLNGEDYCVTKYNIGDHPELPLPPTVNLVTIGTTCYAESDACCWMGKTASTCDAANGGYDGCIRTNCNFLGAEEACANLSYGDRAWSLMSEEQLLALEAQNQGQISVGLGVNGLRLCDSSSGYNSATCANSYVCTGAYYDECMPYTFWGERSASYAGDANWFGLSSGAFMTSAGLDFHARSVRCITPKNKN